MKTEYNAASKIFKPDYHRYSQVTKGEGVMVGWFRCFTTNFDTKLPIYFKNDYGGILVCL